MKNKQKSFFRLLIVLIIILIIIGGCTYLYVNQNINNRSSENATALVPVVNGLYRAVSYNGNGNTGGSVPPTVSYRVATKVKVENNIGNLTKTGYTFAGWSILPVDRPIIAPGSTFIIGFSNVTLYAKWSPVFSGGDGTLNNPYKISSWTQLDNVRNNLSANYVLIANLNSNTADYIGIGGNWIPIGDCGGDECNGGNPEKPFVGNFNGNNKTISNLVINLPTSSVAGLFGYTTGNISNVRLVNEKVSAIGAGGLVGVQGAGIISNSYSTGDISGSSGVGGLVGSQGAGTIINSYSKMNLVPIASHSSYFGGLVGYQSGGSITNSYSTGNIKDAEGSSYFGGLIGDSNGTISSSYWDTQTSGRLTSAGGTGKTTVQMQATSTFAGWNFGSVWGISSGSYPNLR